MTQQNILKRIKELKDKEYKSILEWEEYHLLIHKKKGRNENKKD